MKIILASNNQNKINEIKNILNTEIYSLNDLDIDIEIEEFGQTFEQNALIKCQAISNLYPNDIIIADDSGLCVETLNGAPGVYSARFAIENPEYADNRDLTNNLKLLAALENNENRQAKFVCSICVLHPILGIEILRGEVAGTIASDIQGSQGFGYDPIFINNGQRFSELTREQKNQISHRAQALAKLKECAKCTI